MKDGRIHLRLERWLAEEIKEYAKRHGTTVSALADSFFRDLIIAEKDEQVMGQDVEQI